MSESLERMELKISIFLRYGVLLAGALMAIGWLGGVSFSGNPFEAFQVYGHDRFQVQLARIIENREYFAIISYIGLVTLISLPILRVALTAVLFFKQREYLLSGIAVFVLIALAASFQLGLIE